MSWEAYGDGDDGLDGYVTEERAEAMVSEAAAELVEALTEVVGCFDAAYAEGLQERLAEADIHAPGTLADLINRRLLLALTAAQAALERHKGQQPRPSFQSRVAAWMDACFGPTVSGDKVERNHRFLEEALELVQASGCSREDCLQLVNYVYGRPVGEPSQEVGGVMVTLAALCLANDLDMEEAAETELARVWTKIEQIRAKQAAKPRGSALPVSPSYPSEQAAEPLTARNAPIGTRAPAIMGGAWYRTESGWKWNGPDGSGGTFPTPGGDWDGRLIQPEPAKVKPAKGAV